MLNKEIKDDLNKIWDCLDGLESEAKTSEARYICRRLVEVAMSMGNLLDEHDLNKN